LLEFRAGSGRRILPFGADLDVDLNAHYEPEAITRNLLADDDVDDDDDDGHKTPSAAPSLPLRTAPVPRLLVAVPPPFPAYVPVLHRRNKCQASRYRSYFPLRFHGASQMLPFRIATTPAGMMYHKSSGIIYAATKSISSRICSRLFPAGT
jgi:hypothetical protein